MHGKLEIKWKNENFLFESKLFVKEKIGFKVKNCKKVNRFLGLNLT